MSWDQLYDIFVEAKNEKKEEELAGPSACPNDGTPLESGPDNELFCPYDGWRP